MAFLFDMVKYIFSVCYRLFWGLGACSRPDLAARFQFTTTGYGYIIAEHRILNGVIGVEAAIIGYN